MTVHASLRRIVSRGELPGSDGGIYNPGALLEDGAIVLLARREIDYRFTPIVHAERIVVDPATFDIVGHRTLVRRGFPDDARIEDFRLIRHRGETLAIHTVVSAGCVRPVLSRVGEREIELVDPLDVPFTTTRIEKNWVLFEHEGELHCLYRLDPLTILVHDENGRWRVRKRVDNGWGDAFPGMLSNSANLVPFLDGYLGFWHSVVDGRYVQGAMLLDRGLDLAYTTGVLLDGRAAVRGYKDGVLYVSALVVHDGRVLAFYGEGDAHTGVAIFDANELGAALRLCPFEAARPLTVHVGVRSMGALYRAMTRLQDQSRRAGAPRVWVHLESEAMGEVVRRFGIPGVTARDLSHRDRVHLDFEEALGR